MVTSMIPRLTRNITRRIKSFSGRIALARLRQAALRAPRFQPGIRRVGPFTVAYSDLFSLYMEIKDIFSNQIYSFEPPSSRPVIIDGGGCIGISVLYFK